MTNHLQNALSFDHNFSLTDAVFTMGAITLEIFFWAYGIAATIFGIFAAYLGVGWKGGKQGARLLIVVTLSFIWAICASIQATSWSNIWIANLAILLDLGRLVAWSAFLIYLLSVVISIKHLWVLWHASWGIGLFALAMSLFGRLLDIPDRWRIFPALVISIWLLALIEQVFRNFPSGSRWGIKPLCIGLIGAFAFDLYLYADAFLFGRINIDMLSVRGAVHALAVPLIAISATRSHDWTFRISVSRDLVFHSAALAACGGYLLLISAAGYYVRWFGGAWGPALQVTLIFAGLLLLVLLGLSGAFRARLRVLLSKHFFTYRYDYRRSWLNFTQALSIASKEHTSLEENVINALADFVESAGGYLWQKDLTGSWYKPYARLNLPEMGAQEPVDSQFCKFMLQKEWIFNLEEWRSQADAYEGLDIPEWLQYSLNAWLILPLIAGNDLKGFVVLANSRIPIDVDWEVLDLLKTASRQAAGYLAQSQALAALLEAQKFDSFNRMSAFVVHDLKNLVAQLSLMLKNADRHKDNPEFQVDMLMTVEHVAEKMRGLMNQLQNKSPIEQKRTIDLVALCKSVCDTKHIQKPLVDFQSSGHLNVIAHVERLQRIIGHVVQNAIEATPQNGNVRVCVEQMEGLAGIKVCDTGSGMSPEFIREKLFRPFQTTKHNGMGIGTYEVQQYVKELGGKVIVDSEVGRGTNFTIFLPLSNTEESMAA